ncbi:hypothetical protein BGW80DRAFT_860238 [Lactifluus volemus]|nr:hypothetical protein BGW80DRAFT_860238 [Lactifluus volemus]
MVLLNNRQSTCSLPADEDPNIDEVVGGTTARDLSSSTPTSPNDFDISTLPPGWNSIVTNTASRQLTIAVLVLSVALAIIIVAIMFTCVFRRRKSAPKRDPEKKSPRSPNVADDRSIREAKAAQRKWSRATSRWRDNIRFAARRRRSNWTLTTSASYTTQAREESAEVGIESQGSPPSSRSPTPTPSQRTSSAASIHSPTTQTRASHELEPQLHPNDVPSLNPVVPSQPPAYYAPPSSSSAPVYTQSGCSSSSSPKVPLASHTPPQAHDGGDYLSSISGHVATDDKAILSHRVALASAPPGAVNSHISQSVSVPSLEDVDIFELPCGSRLSSPHIDAHGDEPHPPYSPPTFMLPPPPSKGKQKYDYSRDLDIDVNRDIVTVEPDLGPSAPPFEENGTAPPFDPDVLVPSAPPMPSEDLPESDDMDGWDEWLAVYNWRETKWNWNMWSTALRRAQMWLRHHQHQHRHQHRRHNLVVDAFIHFFYSWVST